MRVSGPYFIIITAIVHIYYIVEVALAIIGQTIYDHQCWHWLDVVLYDGSFRVTRGRPELPTFSTYEITSHKREGGKKLDNLITFVQHIHSGLKCTNLCKNECHHMRWFDILRSIETDSPN